MKADIDALTNDLKSRIDYWRKEAELTYAEVIGVLEILKIDIYTEAVEQADDEGNEVGT